MKILIFCVNFNSYKELNNYLHSIEIAFNYNNNIQLEIWIADNTINDIKKIDLSSFDSLNINIQSYNKNIGYLGAITKLIEHKGFTEVKKYDYVIFSNVDLLLSETFFKDLINSEVEENVGWIAPKIFSISENRDRNPKILERPSLKRLNTLILMFKNPLLYRFYRGFVYKLRSKRMPISGKNKIYAGHGSIMIFTKSFMSKNVSFEFPSFLFCEEIYLGELARLSKLKVIYLPDIVVHDLDHVSTSKMKWANYCQMNLDSLNIIKNTFWV